MFSLRISTVFSFHNSSVFSFHCSSVFSFNISSVFLCVFLVCFAIKTLKEFVVGRNLADIFKHFGNYWRELTSDPQTRWVSTCMYL